MSGGWDLRSTHSLEAGAEWFRKKADATCVFVVRGGDLAFAVAPGMKLEDAREAVEFALAGAVEELERQRREAEEAATRKRAAKIAGLR
jgi:hypothetical protein